MPTFAHNAALLIIDVQKGFDDAVWGRRNNPQLEERVAELLDAWRDRNAPVIHVRHMSSSPASPLRPGQAGNDFKLQARPLSGEAVYEKSMHSAFIGTTLKADLRRRGMDTLVIAGLTTNHCVSTTTRMAADLGFTTWLVGDATATFDRRGPDGREYTAEQIQAIALSDLHGEFATVVDCRIALAAIGPAERRVEMYAGGT